MNPEKTGKVLRYAPYIPHDKIEKMIEKNGYQTEAEKKAFRDACVFSTLCFAITRVEYSISSNQSFGLE